MKTYTLLTTDALIMSLANDKIRVAHIRAALIVASKEKEGLLAFVTVPLEHYKHIARLVAEAAYNNGDRIEISDKIIFDDSFAPFLAEAIKNFVV